MISQVRNPPRRSPPQALNPLVSECSTWFLTPNSDNIDWDKPFHTGGSGQRLGFLMPNTSTPALRINVQAVQSDSVWDSRKTAADDSHSRDLSPLRPPLHDGRDSETRPAEFLPCGRTPHHTGLRHRHGDRCRVPDPVARRAVVRFLCACGRRNRESTGLGPRRTDRCRPGVANQFRHRRPAGTGQRANRILGDVIYGPPDDLTGAFSGLRQPRFPDRCTAGTPSSRAATRLTRLSPRCQRSSPAGRASSRSAASAACRNLLSVRHISRTTAESASTMINYAWWPGPQRLCRPRTPGADVRHRQYGRDPRPIRRGSSPRRTSQTPRSRRGRRPILGQERRLHLSDENNFFLGAMTDVGKVLARTSGWLINNLPSAAFRPDRPKQSLD